MAIDRMEFFDIVDENDKVIGKISEEMQNTVKPAQLRFINIIIINSDDIRLLFLKEVLLRDSFLIAMIFLLVDMLTREKIMIKLLIESSKKN